MFLHEQPIFNYHFREKIAKTNKRIGVIYRLNNILPRQSLITIYKSFVRPDLEYYYVINDQPNNETFVI